MCICIEELDLRVLHVLVLLVHAAVGACVRLQACFVSTFSTSNYLIRFLTSFLRFYSNQFESGQVVVAHDTFGQLTVTLLVSEVCSLTGKPHGFPVRVKLFVSELC